MGNGVPKVPRPRTVGTITHPDKVSQWGTGVTTPLLIVGGTLGAAAIAILHYCFDAHLDGKPASGFWNQITTHRLENALATLFALLFSTSAGVSLCQVSWYIVRSKSLPISDLDVLLGPPTWKSLFHIRLITQVPFTVAIVVAITASPLIPIFAPSLTVHTGNLFIRNITVPTLDLATDNNLRAIHLSKFSSYGFPSDEWDTTTLRAIVADQALGWPIPQGCAPECNYNITYDAVALQCSDLMPNQISDGLSVRGRGPAALPNPLAYLFGYDGSGNEFCVLNVSIQDPSRGVPFGQVPIGSEKYGITLAYLPSSSVSADAPVPYGSNCTFYNATHLAQVSYFNGTQVNSVRVVEYHDALNTTYKLVNLSDPNANVSERPPPRFAPGTGRHANLLAMADTLADYFAGTIDFNIIGGSLIYNATQLTFITKTDLFSIEDSEISTSFSLNEAGGITNLSKSLVEVVANVTLNFMNLNLGNASVVATSPSQTNIYQYKRLPLLATYGIALAILCGTSAVGFMALVKNGVSSSNKFSQVLATTRNPTLDACAAGACLGTDALTNKTFTDIRLRFGEVATAEGPGTRHAAFGVVDKENVDTLQRKATYI